MRMKVSEFGKTKSGEEVSIFKFKNEFVELEIISYGGVIKSLKTADKNGEFENVVLGYETLKENEEDECYLGAITGRVAGRIKDGVLKIGDSIYNLEKNNSGNNLHGGPEGLNTRVWKAKG